MTREMTALVADVRAAAPHVPLTVANVDVVRAIGDACTDLLSGTIAQHDAPTWRNEVVRRAATLLTLRNTQ